MFIFVIFIVAFVCRRQRYEFIAEVAKIECEGLSGKILGKYFESTGENTNFAQFFRQLRTMGKFTAFNLPLKSLAPGEHQFDFDLDKQFFVNMENSDIHGGDLKAVVTVKYNGDVYALHFAVNGTVTLICDRCLDELVYPIENATYDITVKYGERYNDDSDDVLEIPQGDTTLNVAYMIYDTVVIAIPIKHVHPMGKCNRAMSALLKKHRARVDDEDAELEDDLMEDIESYDGDGGGSTDPRWNALRKLGGESEADE